MNLDVKAPADFVRNDTRLPPPDLSEAPQIKLETWRVDENGSSVLVGACFTGKAGAWLPEADEIALQKLEQSTLSTAMRAGLEVTMRPSAEGREGALRTQMLEGEGLHAKTMLGFEESGVVHGCFALCVRSDACRVSVNQARIEGALVEPPEPSHAMRAVSWSVHHPQHTLVIALFVCALAATGAIVTRKRPKTRFAP